jgi:lysophosphatidate acyltransferase
VLKQAAIDPRRSLVDFHRRAKMTVLLTILKFYLAMPAVMLSGTLIGYLTSGRKTRFFSRCVASYISLLLCASYGIVASIFLRIVGRQHLAQWTTARSFELLTTPLVNWSWEIEGGEILSKNRPAVFISNHQSEMDVLVLGKVSHVSDDPLMSRSFRNTVLSPRRRY